MCVRVAGTEAQSAGRVVVEDWHPGGAAADGVQAAEHRGYGGRQEGPAPLSGGRQLAARTLAFLCCMLACQHLRFEQHVTTAVWEAQPAVSCAVVPNAWAPSLNMPGCYQ